MKTIIGKKYIPCDNSWAVNVTKAGSYSYKNNNAYLAGIQSLEHSPKECTIISEPFECITNTSGIPNSKKKYTMIMVEFQEETHMVLFFEHCIQ